jgi:hypothetical protein
MADYSQIWIVKSVAIDLENEDEAPEISYYGPFSNHYEAAQWRRRQLGYPGWRTSHKIIYVNNVRGE